MKKTYTLFAIIAVITWVSYGGTSYKYYVPLPEKTFSGAWHFLIEAGTVTAPSAELAEPFDLHIQVTGYNVLGMETVRYEPIHRNTPGGFEFSPFSEDSYKTFSVQSLLFESNMEIQGVMWIYNEETGQLNAVKLSLQHSAQTTIPQIGTNYFFWKSGFSMVGVTDGDASTSDISFRYYDTEGRSFNADLWDSLGHLEFLKKTPYFDVYLGELDHPVAAFWGEILCQNPKLGLAGYQTFSRVDDSTQTSSFELNEPASDCGSIPLFRIEHGMSHWVTLTNPAENEVQVKLSLHYTSPYEVDDEIIYQNLTKDLEVSIPPKGRLSGVIGTTWFAELFQDKAITPQRFNYSVIPSVPPEGEEVTINPVFALAFASFEDKALAAAYIQPAGNRSAFWLTGQDLIQRTLMIQNTTEKNISCKLTIYTPEGKIIGYNRKSLEASVTWNITETALSDIFKEPGRAVYFVFECEEGTFSASMLGERATGLSLVNLPLELVRTETDSDDQGDTP
jgi:hypothetical protein